MLTPGGDLICVVFQGPEFIQFLQQEYLPSLQVAPEISQVGISLWQGPLGGQRLHLMV